MRNNFYYKSILILFAVVSVLATAYSQKKESELPHARVQTREDFERFEKERKEYEESNKRQKAEFEAMNKTARINGYQEILLNDIFKFAFPIIILIGIPFSFITERNEGLEHFLPGIILIGIYFLYCLGISDEDEFQDCFLSTLKIGLTTIVISSGLISLLVNLNFRKAKLTNSQKSFILIFSIIFTAMVAYLLTNNITPQSTYANEEKSKFIVFPWNWLAFLILNGALFYTFKIKKPLTINPNKSE